MISDPKTATGSAFVKSLEILLRYARLYGFEHARTADQLRIAFEELVAATHASVGLLLGAADSRLLLDGVPLEGAAEKQFAHMLSAAGLGSVQFFPTVTEEELARFARAFATGKAKPSELARELKAALAGAQGIRVNEIFFVATDSRLKESTIAAQLATASLGNDQEHVKEWLNDPKKTAGIDRGGARLEEFRQVWSRSACRERNRSGGRRKPGHEHIECRKAARR